MAPRLDRAIRQGAFTALQKVRRTGLLEQVREIDKINSDPAARSSWRESAVAHLLNEATTAPQYAAHRGKGLPDFPILSKAELKQDTGSFRTQGYSTEELIAASTSGSYGVPLTLLLTQHKKRRQQAEVIHFGRWADYQVGTSHLYVRASSPKSKLKLWAQNEWFASTNHPNQAWAYQQIDLIRRKRIQAIIGYPSTIALLASAALESNLSPKDFTFRSAIAIGEALREEQRNLIESAFGGICLSRYTAEEVGVIAAECPEERKHHINEASYIVEVLDLEKDEPAQAGELGRIVVTDLYSHAMPLIRYDIGDLGVLGGQCACGRSTSVLERIEGRTIETILDSQGGTLNPFFINPIMNKLSGIQQYQFAQIDERTYQLRLIGKNLDELDVVKEKFMSVLGKGADLELKFVESIPALPSGKRPYVINEWTRRSTTL